MQVLYDTFDVPAPQEFVERTAMITRKRKHTEKLEVDPKQKKYKVQYVVNSPERGAEVNTKE